MKNECKVLEIKGLSISFRQYDRGLRQRTLHTIRHLDVNVDAGEMVAIVGASGSGKSLLAHAVLGILPYNSSMDGEMFFCGERLDQKRKEKLRGSQIVLVPQSTSFLDPLMKVEGMYPFELSGGMARRILISAAAIEKPKLVIADEPTPGLHMEAAKMVMSQFRAMADEGAGVLVITHDLELARETADRILVFYDGESIEEAAAADFFDERKLRHPFSRALVCSIPSEKGGRTWQSEIGKGEEDV